MPYAESPEQRDFRTLVAALCTDLAGTRAQRDALTAGGTRAHSETVNTRLADLGWAGIRVPEQFGGSGGSHVDMCILLEETARGLLPAAHLGPTLIVGAAYERFGSPEQKKAVLGSIASGGIQSISMSEPGAGSDVAALGCRATRTDDGWVVNGQKTWCSNAHVAQHILLVARTSSRGSKHDGITMFHVPAGTPGMQIRQISTMGGREVNDIFFTDAVLPLDAVIGEVGDGWRQLMAGLNVERLILGAMMLGTARRAFDDTLAFITQRTQFGQPVGTFQALRHRMADHATEIACTRLLTYDLAAMADENPGALFPREASMVKLKATETAKAMAIDGMQMMGGYGYATEFDMEALVRSSIVSTVYGGTSEIQRDIIGRSFGL